MSDELGRESGPPSDRTRRPVWSNESRQAFAEDRMHDTEHEPEGWEKVEDPYTGNHG